MTESSSSETPAAESPKRPESPGAGEIQRAEDARTDSSAAVLETVRRTRLARLWTTVTLVAVVAAVVLVFIVQNNQPVEILFFGLRGHLPLGVALMVAAICGVLLVVVLSYGRIVRLQRALRRLAGSGDADPAVPRADRGQQAEGDTVGS